MEGLRGAVASPDGVSIGLLTAGSGPALLLVHGGLGSIDSWQSGWDSLTGQFQVTAMDRRGRGTSGDADGYSLEREYADVAAVAALLADEQGGPVDVVGHSYGATCVLGAAARGAPVRRIVLYEPPGPQTVRGGWADRVGAMVAGDRDRVGRRRASGARHGAGPGDDGRDPVPRFLTKGG
jgi:pimeloyl-ACP methyl ester carboxylesterase